MRRVGEYRNQSIEIRIIENIIAEVTLTTLYSWKTQRCNEYGISEGTCTIIYLSNRGTNNKLRAFQMHRLYLPAFECNTVLSVVTFSVDDKTGCSAELYCNLSQRPAIATVAEVYT